MAKCCAALKDLIAMVDKYLEGRGDWRREAWTLIESDEANEIWGRARVAVGIDEEEASSG